MRPFGGAWIMASGRAARTWVARIQEGRGPQEPAACSEVGSGPMVQLVAAALVLASVAQASRVFCPESELGTLVGYSVAGLGDVDADGAPDFLIADPGGPGPGRVWLVSGKTNRVIYERDGDEPYDYFGWELRAVGDVDGDGIPDWIAGADHIWNFKVCGGSFASVHSGRDGSRLHLFRSDDADEELGRCFGGAGDVEGDGKEDLVIGARRVGTLKEFVGTPDVHLGIDGKRPETL